MFACVYLSRSLRLSHQLAGGTGSPPCMQDPLSGPGWELGNTICFAEFFKRLKITNQMEFGNHPWLPIFSPLPASQLCHQWLGDDFSVTSQRNDFFSLLNSISAKATVQGHCGGAWLFKRAAGWISILVSLLGCPAEIALHFLGQTEKHINLLF